MEASGGSVHERLMELLPRLRRFAGVLANGAEDREALLRDACEDMLVNPNRHQAGAAFEHWAFAEIYGMWLKRLRERADPIAHGPAEERLFLPQTVDLEGDLEFAAFLRGLPAQQRVVMLLVYGEGYSYGETAKLLDTPLETVAQRAARGLVAFAAHLDGVAPPQPREADIRPLYPQQKRAPA